MLRKWWNNNKVLLGSIMVALILIGMYVMREGEL